MTIPAIPRRYRRWYGALEPEEQEEWQQYAREVTLPPESFADYVAEVMPGYEWYAHCRTFASVVERITAGELRRVILTVPPRHGKSLTFSRLLPGYYLRHHPDQWVALTSYSAKLAYTHSRHARRYYGGRRKPQTDQKQGVEEWETGQGGGMWAAGYGGSQTGYGYHLGIVDDPVKNAEEAHSETIRRRNEDFWDSVFYTRREPGASILIILTRWTEDDPVGYVLGKPRAAEEGWHVVDLPALKEPEPEPFYPEWITVETDDRKPGEALCPERFDVDDIQLTRDHLGAYWFNALYQCRPRPREGGMFKRSSFEIVDTVPPQGDTGRSWDLAATEAAGDYTAGVKMRRVMVGKGKDRRAVWYVLDVVRGQWAGGERDRRVRAAAEDDGPEVMIYGQQDPGAAGKDAAAAFRRLLEGYGVHVRPMTGAKTTRADPMASYAEAEPIRLLRGTWNKAFLDECLAFPHGAHDDQVDAAAEAFNRMAPSPMLAVVPGGETVPGAWAGV